MNIGRKHNKLDIHVNGTTINQVKEFKYLGSIFTEDGRLDREIEARVQKANDVTYQLAPLLNASKNFTDSETTDDQQHFHTYFVLPEPNMDNEQSAGTNSNYM